MNGPVNKSPSKKTANRPTPFTKEPSTTKTTFSTAPIAAAKPWTNNNKKRANPETPQRRRSPGQHRPQATKACLPGTNHFPEHQHRCGRPNFCRIHPSCRQPLARNFQDFGLYDRMGPPARPHSQVQGEADEYHRVRGRCDAVGGKLHLFRGNKVQVREVDLLNSEPLRPDSAVQQIGELHRLIGYELVRRSQRSRPRLALIKKSKTSSKNCRQATRPWQFFGS